MKVIISGLGMYNYLLPALSAWAVRMGYELPDTDDTNLRCYYCDEMEDDVRGNHLYYNGNTILKIRPGIADELSTWAHEFAHMIQSTNLGKQWRRSYDTATEDSGYWNNVFEIEARECGEMAKVFEERGWLFWEVDYNTEGVHSVWPKARSFGRSMGGAMVKEYYREAMWYEVVDFWESDYFRYDLPALIRLTTLVKIILKMYSSSYTNINAVTNMQQYAA